MHKDRTLYECNEKEIEELLLGHKIVADENNDTLILDNGVRLLITPNSGCDACPSGNYYLEHIASVNNAITNVEFVNEHEDSDYDDFDDEYYQHYKIFVIADGMTTELLDVYGTDGNGYYGTGYKIDVYLPDED
nr:MAG TPA: hypothetical protein [Caudoviricetes sp.]